jgi:DNA topoisomerase I
MDTLFIIEAPGKAKTLENLLAKIGMPARVQATKGHLMSMPNSLRPLGIDQAMRDFARAPRDPAIALRVRKEAEQAKSVYVATDADQEGDVIAWDVAELIRDIHPAPLRVKMRGMDEASVREAIQQATPVSKEDAIPGRTRAIIDRMIGATFSSGDVAVGRVSTALLGLVRRDQPTINRVRLVAPAKGGGRPWIAEADVKAPLDKAISMRLVRLDFPALDMKGDRGPQVSKPAHMGDILVAAGDRLNLSPKDASDSMQRIYEAGRMSYPRAGSRGLSESAAAKIAAVFRRGGHMVQAANYERKAETEVHDAPYPIGNTDPNLDPSKLSQDEGVRQVVVRGLVRSGLRPSSQFAHSESLVDFLKGKGFSEEVAKAVATFDWRREHGPRVPGQDSYPESEVISRRPDTVLLEAAVKAGLGRPSTWPKHIEHFMNRGLVDNSLALTERGQEWIQASPAKLLDPRLSAGIERACEARGAMLMSDPEHEPWELLSAAILAKLPAEIREPLHAGISIEPPHPKTDIVQMLSLGESLVEKIASEPVNTLEYAPAGEY